MAETKPKSIKPGKRGYTMKEVVSNLEWFLNQTQFGNIQMKVHNSQIVVMKMFPEINARRDV